MPRKSRQLKPVGVDVITLCAGWDIAMREVHCSNCRHAIVSGQPERPQVQCENGYGRAISLWQLIRAKNPSPFRSAASCPDFDSMSDDEVGVA